MPRLDVSDHSAVRAFITANTRLLTPPLVPEVCLHLAEESLDIWRKTEEDLGEMNIAPPFWAFAWAGGQALARAVLDQPAFVAGKRVLDLGCGSGLAAVAALKAGAASVLAADIDRLALIATDLNAEVNGVVVETTAADLLAGLPTPFDTILVGDLFYERQLAERVLALVEPLAKAGRTVLVGDPQRNYFPRGRFTEIATYKVPVTRDLEDAEIKNTAVWQV
jgi:predicted nicotinamide N-methyase